MQMVLSVCLFIHFVCFIKKKAGLEINVYRVNFCVCSPGVSERIVVSCVCVTLLLMGMSVLLLYKFRYIKTRGDNRTHTQTHTWFNGLLALCDLLLFYFLPAILNSNYFSSLSQLYVISWILGFILTVLRHPGLNW